MAIKTVREKILLIFRKLIDDAKLRKKKHSLFVICHTSYRRRIILQLYTPIICLIEEKKINLQKQSKQELE